MVDISLASEDILSETTLTKIILSLNKFRLVNKLGRSDGCGNIIKNIEKYNALSRIHHVMIMLDLDLKASEDVFLEEIYKKIRHREKKLLFSVPVREVESWILADKVGLSQFLRISEDKIDNNPDQLLDPKEKIVNLAKSAKNAVARAGIPPKAGSAAKVGISYNSLLKEFVNESWSIERARQNSPSLNKTMSILEQVV
ncbi:TPA: hypothetical protein SMI49_000624 [Serratia marcescens]|nr:hypothetical protein [Serratia marcescens]